MPTTPHYALRYPLPTDPADVPTDMSELAEDIDAALYGVQSAGAFAGVALTVAGLGTPSAGKIGVIRLMPTTYNNGGATALPAAIITVGDTSEFPTSGVLSTPNGDVTYTGKTATTFTGCTGGVGTLSALAVIQLKTGTPPSGTYDCVPLIYDAVQGKWLSISILQWDQASNTAWQVTPGGLNTWTDIPAPAGNGSSVVNNPAVPWRAADAAGLKPQVRLVGGDVGCQTPTVTAQYRPSFRSRPARSNTGSTNIGGDTSIATPTVSLDGNDKIVEGTPWGSIPAYTLADLFLPGVQTQQLTGSLTNIRVCGTLAMRWVA